MPDSQGNGRPTLLTPALEAVLIAALLATPVKKYAAEHGGISERTWHTWEAKGETELIEIAQTRGGLPEDISLDNLAFHEGGYAHFLLSVRKARADYLLLRLGRIQQAADGATVRTTKTVTRTDASGSQVIEQTVTEKVEAHWTAEAWLVERQYPEYRTQRVEVSGRDGAPVEISQESAAERLGRVLDEMVDREQARPEILADLEPSEETADHDPRESSNGTVDKPVRSGDDTRSDP